MHYAPQASVYPLTDIPINVVCHWMLMHTPCKVGLLFIFFQSLMCLIPIALSS
jgi:hypothetical protein